MAFDLSNFEIDIKNFMINSIIEQGKSYQVLEVLHGEYCKFALKMISLEFSQRIVYAFLC